MFTQQQQIPRSPLASTLTLVVHVGLALLVIAITAAIPNVPKIASRESLTFMSAAPLPDLKVPLPPPEPAPLPPPRLEAPKPEPKPVEIPIAKPIPPAPVPERKVPEPPREAAPLPKPPPVVVGAFADAAPVARKPERAPDVIVAGFESASAQGVRTRKEVTAIEGFDTATSRPTGTRAGAVTDAGFGAAPAATPQRTTAVATGVGGFGADPTPRPAAAPRQAPSTSGFGETPTPVARPAPPPPPKPRADQPVAVLYKPVPAYTDEARAQRIEGDVSLEVEFTADGQVRVIRVLQGLGHGLDEMASRAAQQIKFRPATAKGVPVDFRATVNITFRLT